jgi:hypothetical protein
VAGERVARARQPRHEGDRIRGEDRIEVGFGLAEVRLTKRHALGASFGAGFGFRHLNEF